MWARNVNSHYKCVCVEKKPLIANFFPYEHMIWKHWGGRKLDNQQHSNSWHLLIRKQLNAGCLINASFVLLTHTEQAASGQLGYWSACGSTWNRLVDFIWGEFWHLLAIFVEFLYHFWVRVLFSVQNLADLLSSGRAFVGYERWASSLFSVIGVMYWLCINAFFVFSCSSETKRRFCRVGAEQLWVKTQLESGNDATANIWPFYCSCWWWFIWNAPSNYH